MSYRTCFVQWTALGVFVILCVQRESRRAFPLSRSCQKKKKKIAEEERKNWRRNAQFASSLKVLLTLHTSGILGATHDRHLLSTSEKSKILKSGVPATIETGADVSESVCTCTLGSILPKNNWSGVFEGKTENFVASWILGNCVMFQTFIWVSAVLSQNLHLKTRCVCHRCDND